MSFLDFFRKMMGRKDGPYSLPIFFYPTAYFPARNFTSFVSEGYKKNVYVRACIDLIARSVAGVEWGLFQNGEKITEVSSHPLMKLFSRPNPKQSRGPFIEALVRDLELGGNAFVLGVGPENGGKPLELYRIPPQLITMKISNSGIEGYEIIDAQGGKQIYTPDQILHLKFDDPLFPYIGSSPMESAFDSIIQNNAARQWNVALLQNYARPAGAFVVPVNEYSRGRLSDEEYARLRERVNEMMGPTSAGRPLILEGGLEWKQIGMNASDLDWLEGLKLSAREIALAFNVPPELIGDNTNKTYSNYQEARKAFYEETILPLMDNLRDEFNRWLVPKFDPSLYLDYDKDDIEALSEDRDKLWARVNTASWLTPNEKRVATGYDEIQDNSANQIYIPLNVMPIGSTTGAKGLPHPLLLGKEMKGKSSDFFPGASSSREGGRRRSKEK